MNRERVQELRDVIAGIPEAQVNLSWPFVGTGDKNSPPEPCGAVACMAGWAWIYPPFIEAGIRKTCASGICNSASAFFNLPSYVHLFSARHEDKGISDKAVALKRLDALLK